MYDQRWGMNNSAALDYGANWRDYQNPYMYAGSQKPSYASYLNMGAAAQQEMERLDLDAQRYGAVDNRGGVVLPVAGRSNAFTAAAVNAQLRGMGNVAYDDYQGGVEHQQRNGGFGTMDYLNSRTYGYSHLPTLQGPTGRVDPREANYLMDITKPWEKVMEASFPKNAGAAPMTQAWIPNDPNPAPSGTREASFTVNGQTPLISTTAGGGIAQYNQGANGSWTGQRMTGATNASPYNSSGNPANPGQTGLGGPNTGIPNYGSNPGTTGLRSYNSFGPGDGSQQNGYGSTRGNPYEMQNRGGGDYEQRVRNQGETSLDIYQKFYQPFGTYNRPGSVYGNSNSDWDKGMGFVMPGQNLPWQLPPAFGVSSYNPNPSQSPGQQMYGGIAGGMLGSYGNTTQYPSGYSNTGYGGVFNNDFGTRRY